MELRQRLQIIEKMQIKLFTIPLFGGEDGIEELNKFLRGNKVVDITPIRRVTKKV